MDRRAPFDDLRDALQRQSGDVSERDGVRVDLGRAERCGIPEIVYCHGKSNASVVSACERLSTRGHAVLATRLVEDRLLEVSTALSALELHTTYETAAQTLVVLREDSEGPANAGTIGLLTAGTSDWPAASVAKLVAEHSGCNVLSYQDCGVAGLHRLVEPLETLIEADVAAIIVAAGMDGVLPSVVAGLVDIPVIGLPTSTGYGHGGGGEGALTTMLQACAPGVAVVNIDNGVGAGSMAALIAMRVTREKSGRQSDEE